MVSDKSTWDTGKLVAEISDIYQRTGRAEAWQTEEAGVRASVETLPKQLARYANPKAVGVGGLGIVLRVEDLRLSAQPCAVKFPRPKLGSRELFSEMLQKEIERLASIRHSGVIRIHAAGAFTIDGGDVPFYVMDFVVGSGSDKYLAQQHGRGIVALVNETAGAILALHSADLVHCDLKPDNILVTVDGHPIITDLGTTKVFQPNDRHQTRIGVTRSFAPRDVVDYLSVASESDPDNFAGLIERSAIRKEWDLICFGKTLLVWLGYKLETGDPSPLTWEFDPYVRKYLLLMASRLLGERDGYAWLTSEVNLPSVALNELRYSTISEVVEDIDKLSGAYSLEAQIPELNAYSPHMVQVGGGEPTALTSRVRHLLEHPSVRRLGSITQLGIVNQVYLTATHTRFEHSLGTYAHACLLVRSLYNDPFSPFFRQVMHKDDITALLALTILHDTGQFPLAHDLEEIDGSLFDHKRLTQAVLRGGRNPKKVGYQRLELPSIDAVLKEWGVSADTLVSLLNVRLDRFAGAIKDRILHSVIDGAVDADKLDYLTRDAHRLDVPYGGAIDKRRIASSATSIVTQDARTNWVACIGVHEKGRVAAEFLTIARSAMFSQVYWHHTVRAMKAMLARAVQRIVVHIALDEERENRFVREFERFVMQLPGSLSPRMPQLVLVDPSSKTTREEPTGPVSATENPGTLAATDAAVLVYLEEYMTVHGLRDADLLRAIRSRALFKRLYVWSLASDEGIGEELAETWNGLKPREKLNVYEVLEQSIGRDVGAAATEYPDTITLTLDRVQDVKFRVQGRLPVLLIDVPASRPGSDIPLYYVREAERRGLRKDGSAVGRANASDTWNEYGRGLQKKAGKLRVFCHPIAVEAVEAAVTRDRFVELFESACATAKGDD